MKKLTLTIVLIALSLATMLFASGYNIIQVNAGMSQGLKFARPSWNTGDYICMPAWNNWEAADTTIYKFPENVIWKPTPQDIQATDYVKVE